MAEILTEPKNPSTTDALTKPSEVIESFADLVPNTVMDEVRQNDKIVKDKFDLNQANSDNGTLTEDSESDTDTETQHLTARPEDKADWKEGLEIHHDGGRKEKFDGEGWAIFDDGDPKVKLRIGEEDKEFSHDEIRDAMNNNATNANWKKANTEKAMELADLRKNFDPAVDLTEGLKKLDPNDTDDATLITALTDKFGDKFTNAMKFDSKLKAVHPLTAELATEKENTAKAVLVSDNLLDMVQLMLDKDVSPAKAFRVFKEVESRAQGDKPEFIKLSTMFNVLYPPSGEKPVEDNTINKNSSSTTVPNKHTSGKQGVQPSKRANTGDFEKDAMSDIRQALKDMKDT